MKHLFFDMDGTLTESRQEIDSEMLKYLNGLAKYPVVISGADTYQMQKQLKGAKVVSFSQNGNYTPLWQHKPTAEQKASILAWVGDVSDDMVEDRGCQISLSLVGHHAPLDTKRAYDPDGSKRRALLEKRPFNVPGIQVKVAGTTCLDFFVYSKGENLKRFIDGIDWDAQDCLYIGDALFPGGNDESVIGVMETKQVSGPVETLTFLKSL